MKQNIFMIVTFVLSHFYNQDSYKNVEQVGIREEKKEVVKKEYYSSKVPIISHDDYYSVLDIKEENKKIEEYSDEEEKATDNIDETILEEKEDENLDDENNKDEVLENSETEKESEEENNEDEKISEEESNLVNEVSSIETKDFIEESAISSDLSLATNDNDTVKEEGYYSPSGKYLGKNNVKVVDVSYYQGSINWDLFARDSDCYGVILRLGYYDSLDKKFEENINEVKRLNIPYGIYLFSYSSTMNGSNKESNFTNEMIDKYDLKPELGIYYDIESWSSKNGSNSDNISKIEYDNIISNYVSNVSNHINNKYKVKVYSGRWYAMNRLGDVSKSYVDWVAEYNKTCKYDRPYSLWQYTSSGRVPGINGNVDISYLLT